MLITVSETHGNKKPKGGATPKGLNV